MSLFDDVVHSILFLNLSTGCARFGPWLSIRTQNGEVYFGNLVSRETRWFPPKHWMAHWCDRPTYGDHGYSTKIVHLPQLRLLVQHEQLRHSVEGGAPYLYESTHGVPTYDSDELDTSLTYP